MPKLEIFEGLPELHKPTLILLPAELPEIQGLDLNWQV